MLNSINKISTSKVKSIPVFLLLFLFFLLSIGEESLHNHKPNERERDDCPALIISHTFSSGITVHFELQNEFKVESIIDIQQIFPTFQQNPNTTYLRGPPPF
ncbi:MAG: hypothetical protein ACYC5G_03765 [Candidatus Doudnabacteria bacterium]